MNDNNHERGIGTAAGSPTGPRRLRAAYVVGGVTLAFCAVVYYLTTTFDEVPSALSQGVPPEQFPQLLVFLIAILTGIMMFEASKTAPKNRKPIPAMVYWTAGLLCVTIAAIDFVGIIAGVMIVCALLPILWGDRRFVSIAIFTVAFPLLSFLLFSKVLEIRFPKGLVEKLFY